MNKFRKNNYLQRILKDKKKLSPCVLEVFIYVEYSYTLTWKEFFEFSQLPTSEHLAFQEIYRKYYIDSNSWMIDLLEGCEIDTFKELKVDYTQYSYLKRNCPRNYEFLIKGLQRKLLRLRYPKYDLLTQKQKIKLEHTLFTEVDQSVSDYDNFYKKKN